MTFRPFEREPDWYSEARCAGMEPEIFFPGQGDTLGMRRAKAICAECQVIAPCLAWGMKEKVGVYGGKSAKERARMKRKLRVA